MAQQKRTIEPLALLQLRKLSECDEGKTDVIRQIKKRRGMEQFVQLSDFRISLGPLPLLGLLL